MSSRNKPVGSFLRRLGEERIILSVKRGVSISFLELQAIMFLIGSLICSCCSLSAYVWGDVSARPAKVTPTAIARIRPTATHTITPAPTEAVSPIAVPTRGGAAEVITGTAAALFTATPTAAPTGTPLPTFTPFPTPTPEPPTPTAPPAKTPTSLSPLPTPTQSQVQAPTRTPRPTRTPLPDETVETTLTATPGQSPTPTATRRPRTPSPTPTHTPTPTNTPTPVPSDLRINHVESTGGLTGEYVLIENKGPHDQDMTGWYLTDADDHTYFFPDGFVLEDGDLVTVWTREGDDTETDLYWGRTSGVWGSSDVATLWDSARNEISVYDW